MVAEAGPAGRVRWWDLRSWRPDRRIVFVFALLLIGANSLYALGALRELVRAQDVVEHTQQVLQYLDALRDRIESAESAQRSYILTGNAVHLERYQAGVAAIPAAFRQVRELTSDHPGQQQRLAALEPLIARRLTLLRGTIESRQQDGGVSEAMFEAGDRAMEHVRAAMGGIDAEERRLYALRQVSARRQADFAQVLLVGGTALSLTILLGVVAVARREERLRRAAEAGLRRSNAELERRVEERTANLADKEQFLATVIDNMHDAILVHRDDAVVLANRRFLALVGAGSPGQVLGRSPLDFYPPEQREAAARRVAHVMGGGASVPLVEQTLARLDGNPVEVETTSIAFTDRGQRTALSILRDITERKAAERQLRHAQKMEAIGQLTGGIAHDFNNLLTVIVANLDILGEEMLDNADHRALVDAALSGAMRGAELTRRLLAFARKQPLEPKVIDLNERLPALVKMLQRTLGEEIRVELKLAADPWPTRADPSQVEDALLNLAINARDAMPNGGTLTIETGNLPLDAEYAAQNPEVVPGDYVCLSVTDTGTGMPAEVIARAVEPFFTTKAMGKGSGLGLSMIYGFAKQSGGHLKIYSEVGHGTTVRLYLPRAVEAGSGEQASLPDQAAPRGGGESVLLVEDNSEVRAAAIRQLGDLGYRVRAAANGPAALAIIAAGERFDLLLTDIVMPEGMTGYELARAVRARQPDIKLLFATGFAEAPADQPRPEGPVLRKPYRRQELGAKLRAVLDGPDPAA